LNLIGRLEGDGKLVADSQEFNRVRYCLDVWQSDGGVKSARGTLSVSSQIGPGKLTLKDGKTIEVFVTTSGKRGSTVIVTGPVPTPGEHKSF
jgi:hypothetical protein